MKKVDFVFDNKETTKFCFESQSWNNFGKSTDIICRTSFHDWGLDKRESVEIINRQSENFHPEQRSPWIYDNFHRTDERERTKSLKTQITHS